MKTKTCDILRYEARGSDFALVRIAADGTRSELVLTATNVVHLGLLAPDFSRRLLASKAGKRSGTVATSFRQRLTGAKLRCIEVMLAVLERSGPRGDWLVMERRSRVLAERLVDRADRLAKTPPKRH